jgi:hypothetical protein
LKKKPKSNRNRVKPTGFGSVRFFREKPVQIGLARFFRFWLGFFQFWLGFFWFGSVFPVWLGFGSIFFSGFLSVSVRFGFFRFFVYKIETEPNRLVF